MKQESETWSKVKMTGRLRHSGHTQSPLSSAFPIIILARIIHVHSTSAERLSAQWLFFHISIRIAVAVSTTVLVLLQVVFMGWEIVLIISAW